MRFGFSCLGGTVKLLRFGASCRSGTVNLLRRNGRRAGRALASVEQPFTPTASPNTPAATRAVAPEESEAVNYRWCV